MSQQITLARPYAKAAFEYAHEHHQIPVWSNFLMVAGEVIKDKKVRFMLEDPRVEKATIIKLINEVLDNKLDENQENFLKLLVHYRRLNILPEISELFKQLMEEQQKAIKVQITAAFPINKQQQEKFIKALKIRLQREVTLETNVDKELIGGAIIHAGDFVIDGSVKTQIERMKVVLEE